MQLDEVSLKEVSGSNPLEPAIRSFVTRLMDSAQLGCECLVVGVSYLERVRACGLYSVTRVTFCILITACLLIGSKFLIDKCQSTKYWAEVTGFSAQDIANAEREVLRVLNWDLYTTSEDISDLLSQARDTLYSSRTL